MWLATLCTVGDSIGMDNTVLAEEGNYGTERQGGSDVEELLRRRPILEAIQNSPGPLTQRDIVDECDVSKSTAHRATTSLVSSGVLERQDRGYVLTQLGEILTERTRAYVEHVQEAIDHPELLAFVAGTGLAVEDVRESHVVWSSAADPLAPLTRLEERTRDATRVSLLTDTLTPQSFSATDQDARHTELTVVVDENTVVDSRGTDGPGPLAELLDKVPFARVDLFVHEGVVPFQVHLLDDTLCLSLSNANGLPHGLLETEAAAAVDWGRRTIERYRRDARRVQPASLGVGGAC